MHVIAGTAQMAGQLYNASRDGSALVITAGLNDNEKWSDESVLAPRPGFDQKDIQPPVHQDQLLGGAVRRRACSFMPRRARSRAAATEPGGPVYMAMAH